MARMKIDGVIEAVRYTPGGLISIVRTYERRGAVWSDHVLLGRQELVARLRNGKRFVTGERKEYLGSVFETGATVRYVDEPHCHRRAVRRPGPAGRRVGILVLCVVLSGGLL